MSDTATSPRRRGPVPWPFGPLAARLYAIAIRRRNARFDTGRGIVRFDRPTISVGNLSVGGTGKTPTVRWIVDQLLRSDHRPCIAMRGYRARGTLSDEAEEYRRAFPTVPVVAQPDRTRGLIELFAAQHDSDSPHSDCIVLDDGFQHRQIARDLDIVLLDATRDPFDDRLLPAGYLREPAESLRRASVVVLTHAQCADPATIAAIESRVRVVRGQRGLDAITRHAWHSLSTRTADGTDENMPVDTLRSHRVMVCCAIGNPQPFLRSARSAAGSVVGEFILPDHDPFDARSIHRLISTARHAGATAILVTEKDWSKLALRRIAWPCPVIRPQLTLTFDRGGQSLAEAVLATAQMPPTH